MKLDSHLHHVVHNDASPIVITKYYTGGRTKKRWAGHVASMEERKRRIKVSVAKIEGKRMHGRTRCRWKDNITYVLKK
jgi:hypothetical protein